MEKSRQSMVNLMKGFSFAQNSNIKIAVLTSILSLILFFTIAYLSPFKDKILFSLFPKQASYASESLIYSDSLSSGWYNWSWSSDVDFFSTAIVRSGDTAIAFTPQAWGGLSPAMSGGTLDTTPYTNLSFYVNGGSSGGQQLSVEVRNGNLIGSSVNINTYIEGGSVVANQWRKVDIPLNVLKGSTLANGVIDRIAIKETLGTPQSTVYIDDLGFYSATVPTPTITPIPSFTPTPTPTPTTTSTPSPSINPNPTTTPITTPTIIPTDIPTITLAPVLPTSVIFSDSLARDWLNWSWSSNVNLNSTKYAYSGKKSIAFSPISTGGFSPALRNKTFDLSQYNQLSFYINGGTSSNQLFTFELRSGSAIGPALSLNNYIDGGKIVANQWKRVKIPLTDLKGSVLGNTIDRMAMQSTLSTSQSTVYIDEIIFTNEKTPNITPSLAPNPTNTPTPTKVITVTPTPVVQSCAVSTASWQVSANPITEGALTNLDVITTGNCDGKMVAFEVWAGTGVGGVGDSISKISPPNTAIVNNKAVGSWVAEYLPSSSTGIFQQVVSFFENIVTANATTSEYYFKAKVVDDNHTINSAPPNLMVNQAPPAPNGDIINIDAGSVLGSISSDFYGNNLTPYGGPSMTRDENFINKVAPLKYNTIRIPGGYEADGYHWWNGTMATIPGVYMWNGNPPQLADYNYFAERVGAKAMITINYRTGTPLEAANWVEYMNSPVPTNPNPAWTTTSYSGNQTAPKGYFAWLRAQPGPTTVCKVCVGRLAPYGAKYWEIGNEVYFFQDANGTRYETPAHYAAVFAPFADAMKAVDPNIKIGFVMEAYDRSSGSWSAQAINALKANNNLSKVDFMVIHWYRFWDDNSQRSFDVTASHDDFVKYAGSYPKIVADWMRGLLEAASPGSSSRIEFNLTEWGPNSGQPCDYDVLSIYSHLYALRTLAEAQLARYGATTYWNITQGNDNYSMIQPNYQVGPIYWAFDMLKYFGRGGDQLISANSGSANVFAYASKLSNGSLSILLLNNSGSQSNITMNLTGFTPNGNATIYQYDQSILGTNFPNYCTHGAVSRNGGPQNPPRQLSMNGLGSQFNLSLPADSSTIMVLPSSSGAPALTLTPTATQTVTPTPTPTTIIPTVTPAPVGGMYPNMLISRGKQVASSSGDAASLINGIYNDYGWRPGIPSASSPAWVAINIGSGPSRLLINWTNTASYNYTDTGYGTPSDYIIQTSSDSVNGSDGTWSNVVVVANNNVRNRAHSFDFSGKKWVRMYITKTAASSWNSQYGVSLDEVDIHDVSQASLDTWFFMGDSLTANDNRSNQPDFAANINSYNSNYYPVELNGGIAHETTANGVSHIDNWLVLNPDMKYWAINYGGNDAAGNTANTTNFRNNLQTIINKIKAAGKVPVIARIHYIADGNHNNIPAFNAVIDDLVKTNELIPGPDLYTWFYNHQNELGSDRLHPTGAGSVSINRLWAESMRGLYTSASLVNTGTSSTASSSSTGFGVQTILDMGQAAIKTVQDFATQVTQLYTQP